MTTALIQRLAVAAASLTLTLTLFAGVASLAGTPTADLQLAAAAGVVVR